MQLKKRNLFLLRLKIRLASRFLFVLFITSALLVLNLSAEIVVINNRSAEPILIDQEPNDHLPAISLDAGSSRAFYSDTNNVFSVITEKGAFQQSLKPNSVYYFGNNTDGFHKIKLIKEVDKIVKAAAGRKALVPPTIRLAVYVDEEEAMTDRQWQNRLANRIETASEVLESHIGVKLVVDSFHRWQSDNQLRGLEPLLADFEKKVRPPAGTVAVGFSSQLHIHPTRRRTMGGTRGPLRSHLIVKEWAPRVSEVERTEILLHEIGHYLGASHSPEQNSVMRPVLASSMTRLKSQPIQFDPLNTLAMAIVSQELASRSLNRLDQLSHYDRLLLASVYKTIGELMPQDPASPRMLQKVQLDPEELKVKQFDSPEMHQVVQSTLTQITRVATLNRKLPLKNRLAGDDLSDLYIRTAASHVERGITNDKIKPEAFIYSLALAFDRGDRLKQFDFFEDLADKSDPEKDRLLRMNVIGLPTARGRDDTLLHFVDSAAITLLSGSENARFLGYAKEAVDAQPGGSGFSFTDIAANEAGIRFAERLKSGELPLLTLANRFKSELFIPSLQELPEGLSEKKYLEEFGGLGDQRNETMLQIIRNRLDQLPPYLTLQIDL